MKKLFLLVVLSSLVFSCGSSKRASKKSKTQRVITKKARSESKKGEQIEVKKAVSKEIASIIKTAKSFEGTRYKYGGTTKRGMDCSGLIFTSFGSEGLVMPRTTAELSKTGDWVDIKQIKEGDLVFFATRKNSRKVNHVGIVTDVNGDDFSFIHSSSSRGVMISKLSNRYWYLAYVQARRYF